VILGARDARGALLPNGVHSYRVTAAGESRMKKVSSSCTDRPVVLIIALIVIDRLR
jgi:hypothetical protein